MNKEIKEILDELINDKRTDRFGRIMFEISKGKQLLNYITNLQEENKRISDLYETYEEANELWIKKCENYKSRINKAIEYIEEYQEILKEHNGDWLNYQDGFKPYLLNILRGEDNESKGE